MSFPLFVLCFAVMSFAGTTAFVVGVSLTTYWINKWLIDKGLSHFDLGDE